MNYAKLQQDYTRNVIGYSALGIILSTCLGSIAILRLLMGGSGLLEVFLIALVVTVCSAHNLAILTVQKPALIFRLLLISTVVSMLIIIATLF
ncbi:hypothetical protein [Zeaxanthinibacter enoshimensis]|uniref:DUF1634 domain-containing protein n=1 Tax=Zeaxanthinibacter enoshimensis TaxID=392009 RepID=A0A4R6TMW4_9FLAO|nr:hypothetical protein [Zeaxanthinibacter enoshimensis]TDQ31079.1 hypothetical protein CLV82_1780 [Zeaxanthinibacter enoshimensis]